MSFVFADRAVVSLVTYMSRRRFELLSKRNGCMYSCSKATSVVWLTPVYVCRIRLSRQLRRLEHDRRGASGHQCCKLRCAITFRSVSLSWGHIGPEDLVSDQEVLRRILTQVPYEKISYR
jgi:hypothetical protein